MGDGGQGMTEAGKWVLEHSRSEGATRLLLIVLAECAEHCIAMPGVLQLEQKAKVSRRKVFYALRWAEKHGEVEQLQRLRGFTGIYHFTKMGSAQKKRSGSDSAQNSCPYLTAFRARYLGGALRAYIRGQQENLIVMPKHFDSAADDLLLDFLANDLRRKVGLPVKRPAEFRLAP